MSNTGLTRKALKNSHSLWLGFHYYRPDRLGRLQKNVVIETFRQGRTTIMIKCKFEVGQVLALSE